MTDAPQPSKDMNDKLHRILNDYYEDMWSVADEAESGITSKMLDEAQAVERGYIDELLALLLETLNDCLPEKQTRKPDEEYMYCITCNQNIDTLEADCFCSIHNLAIDQTKQNLINKLGLK